MKYNKEKIGKVILAERLKLNMSQDKLGKELGIVGKQISNYEKGKLIPPIDVMLKLCDIFNCELGYLLGEPDYSDGTKIKTAITKFTGLNMDTLNNIRTITGTEKKCLDFGNNSESYRSILNSLFSSAYFNNFIECLYELDNALSKYNKYLESAFNEIEKKIGKERLDEAFKLYNSEIDYMHNTNTLQPEQYKAISIIDDAIDTQRNLSYAIKIARYELHESFENLIESIYPRKV